MALNKRGNHRGMHGNQAKRDRHHAWRGGRMIDSYGYVGIHMPEHPRASARGYVKEHILVVEQARGGRPIRVTAPIHHFDGNRANNQPSNLVVCHNQAYHLLLERRQRAKLASGDANALPCRWCGRFESDHGKLVIWANGKSAHPSCERERSAPYKRAYKQRAKLR